MSHLISKTLATPLLCLLVASSCSAQNVELDPDVKFTDAIDDIPLENEERRKWGNALISDMDGNGFQDLLLTDHGFAVKVYWNENGVFSKPSDVIVGDTHGLSVGDFNKDGQLDLSIALGGGSGSNARNTHIYTIGKDHSFTRNKDYGEPLKKMRGRSSKFLDADNDGDLDMILTGIPLDFSDPKGANYLYKNNGKGQFLFVGYLPRSGDDAQKILITDFDGDLISDVIIYGPTEFIALRGRGDFTFETVTQERFGKPSEFKNLNGIAEIDYDNDGDLDLFLTRETPLEAGDTTYDAGSATLAFYSKRGFFALDDFKIEGDELHISNYQAAYPDLDIFVGEGSYKYEFDHEFHGGQDIKVMNSMALGWPESLERKGLYLGYVGNGNWRVALNTHPPTSGLIKGVKNYTPSKTHSAAGDILLENKDDKFIDVTEMTGLYAAKNHTSVAIGDYNNDGFSDIFMVRQGDLSKPSNQEIYLNTGHGKFKLTEGHGVQSTERGALGGGSDAFDYNHDGRLDLIYANDRGKWHLFKNEIELTEDANYTLLSIPLSPGGGDTQLGARVALSACGHQQVRKVGATSGPYTQGLDTILHFGLGNCTEIEKVMVEWTNGETKSWNTLSSNQLNELTHDLP